MFHSEVEGKATDFFKQAIEEVRQGGEADWAGWVVPIECNFEDVTFTRNARFVSVKFTQGVHFAGTTFAQGADFSFATFTQNAHFARATFAQDTYFIDATFSQNASFGGATFAQDAYFRGTIFKRLLQFERPVVKGRVILEDCKLIDRSSFDSTDVSRITFRRCELSGAVFANSHNLHEATFDRCTWGKLSHPVVWEETQARRELASGATNEKKPRDRFLEAEVVYRELRWSLESRKNFQEADQFAVREMEMRRLAYLGTPDSPWYQRFWGEIRANFLSVPGAYHLFGNYGQSISRPTVGMLILVFVLGPVLLIWTDTMAFPAPFPGYFDAVLRTLRIVALLPDLSSPQGSLPTPEGWRQVAEVFFRLVGPFFALLFAIAVRRRVRR